MLKVKIYEDGFDETRDVVLSYDNEDDTINLDIGERTITINYKDFKTMYNLIKYDRKDSIENDICEYYGCECDEE